MPAIDRFDELTGSIRLILFLYSNPDSNVSTIITKSNVGQKAIYSAKKFLEENNLLAIKRNKTLPYNPLYSLSEKGKTIAKHLLAVEEILNNT